MLNSKLYFLFQSLDKRELKLFSKYVRSPIHNQHKDVIRLFDYLKENENWEKEEVFRAVFPKAVLDIQKLHYVNSYHIKILASFLAWQEWEETDKDIYLLKAYRKKRLGKFFKSKKNSIIKKQESLGKKNVTYYQSNYELAKEEFLLHGESKRSIPLDLQEISETLDISFIADKLKQTCEILSQRVVLRIEYDLGLIDVVINKLEANPNYLKIPAIAIYYYAYLFTLDNDDDASFNQLLELMNSSISLLDKEEQKGIYLLAINFCIKKLHLEIHEYRNIIFNLYRSGLENEVLIGNGFISKWTYNNIAAIGFGLGEDEWVEHFIYDYKERLKEEIREDSFNFNLARLYIQRKEYNKAIPLLVQQKYDDVLDVLKVKLLLVKIYYELGEWDALGNLLENFKIYILRKKNLGYHTEHYENIISFLKKLVKINPFDKKEIKLLREEIISFKVLAERKWLLEKLNGF